MPTIFVIPPSLDEFITSDICRPFLIDELVRKNTKRVFEYLPIIVTVRQGSLESQFAPILEGNSIQSTIIPNLPHLATITRVEELNSIELEEIERGEYYGQGVIVAPFVASVDATVEYELLVADYQNLSKKRVERISVTEVDKYHYIAEEIFSLDVRGNLSIVLDVSQISESSLSNYEIRALADNAILEIDSISDTQIIDWDPNYNIWEQRFLELIRYKRRYGNCDVPREYKENALLGNWVSNQRVRYRMEKLSKERAKRLNDVGFSWYVSVPHYEFEDSVDQLLEYQQIYGHMNVSQLDKKYRRLGRWLNNQRTFKKRGTLSKEKEDRLNEIGIVWNVPEANWNQRLGELSEFYKKHGHFKVPSDYIEYPKLYNWIKRLRKKRPRKDRIHKLKSIGYDWDTEKNKIGKPRRDAWNRHVAELQDFYSEHGHFNVPYSENVALYSWLYRLRRKRPSGKRIEQLQGIGFDWEYEKVPEQKS